MSASIFITKYAAQLKALSPNYDVVYEVSKEEPIVFRDGENVRLAFAVVADTHLTDNENAFKNFGNLFCADI